MGNTYHGACFCGMVEVTVTGEPTAQGYCHCRSCRSWSASPVNAFTLWPPQLVKITKGAEYVATYRRSDMSRREYCRRCGGHLMTAHPSLHLVDVFAASIPDFPFRPQVHVNYQETVLPIRDGLPKLKDFPKEFGGTGETIAE